MRATDRAIFRTAYLALFESSILCNFFKSTSNVMLLHPNLHVCPELMTMMLICSSANASLHCPRCQRTFNTDRRSGFVDLTLSSGASSGVYKEPAWGGVQIFRYATSSSCSAGCTSCGVLSDIQEAFGTESLLVVDDEVHRLQRRGQPGGQAVTWRRNPLVSFVYERGWRQGFAWAGFPGAFRAQLLNTNARQLFPVVPLRSVDMC